MALWYIDALDPRAGMGLATYRDADLNTNTVDLGRPAVFIGPPFFQGESVASRAIGFAATRGSFQLGLFLGDAEVAFATLQGVCEFMRRVYVSSGGGDSDGGISSAPVAPNPESGGGEFSLVPEGENLFTAEMLSFVTALSQGIASMSQLNYSQSEPKEWNRREGDNRTSLVERLGPHFDADTLLAYGSAVLIEELLLRFPSARNEQGTWMRSMMKLGQMLSRLGLFESLLDGPDFDRLRRMAYETDRRYGLFSSYVRDFGAELQVMLGMNPNLYWHHPHYPQFLIGWHPGSGTTDPLDDLSSFPIPSVAAKHVRLNPKSASARDLLSVFLSDPTVLAGGRASLPEASMIVAFALLSSMLIISTGQNSLAPIDGNRIGSALRQDLVREAVVWMDSQMPGHLFHRDIENHIRSASKLRYRSGADESTSAKPTA